MMRGMRSAGRVVDEERQRRIEIVDLCHPVDGIVRHGGDQVPAGFADEGGDRRRVTRQHWLPLAAVTGVESVKVIETHAAGRPLRERTCLACLERRRIVILAPPTAAVAVLTQYPGDRGILWTHDTVIAGEAGCDLRDDTKADRVMIASRKQRATRGRA